VDSPVRKDQGTFIFVACVWPGSVVAWGHASSRSVSLNAVTRRRERTDFHGLDQAVFDGETVANVFITKNGPVQVAHDLMHIDQDSPSSLWMEGNRLDVRVNLGPLLRPVSSDIMMTANDAPLKRPPESLT
jgi:hypothetical protein